MADPDFVNADDDVETVKQEFEGAENTLIVRRDGDVVGEIHENSLLKDVIPEDKLDEENVIGVLGLSFNESYVAEKAEDLMNEHDITVPPDESIGDIAFIMDREDIRAVPVEKEGGIIGVVHEDRVIEEA
ncbi:MAG: CBS domain-containing protein [Candidatus Nanohalobium sp.]